MPLRLDIKRQLSARSDRVKCVDVHPTEPWMIAALYNGTVNIWNYETQTLVKTFEVCELPVRSARFVQRKSWVITGSDDFQIRVFNYNTLEKVHSFEAHSDYLRAIAVHPSQPYLLTTSDDMTIKLWDWNNNWKCVETFEGHAHYVMCVIFNPKDTNTFATASLDRTIKVWQLGAHVPNFTLQGHERGVNCLDYYHGGDKPYLVSGGDDNLVKIWDYQNKTCVQTLDGHTQNVSSVLFHPELPLILTGSEDGTVRIWHSNTYRLENTLNYGLERVWAMASRKGSNSIAIAYDEGSIMIKLGREEPAMSMDSTGKLMWARHTEVSQANLAQLDEGVKDGEPLALAAKDLGSCEIYPQTMAHNPNGRFVVVCGDGEYIIHTALSFRNKSFGSALEFVWAADSSEYAVRESSSKIKIFKNFKERAALKPDFSAEGIYGGFLLGVRGASSLSFYDWQTTNLVRRIDIEARNVYWSESGNLVAITTGEEFFILKYKADAVEAATASGEPIDEEGIAEAFDVDGEIQEVVKTGLWVGDCFIYTNSVNRLNYYVGGEVVTVAHLDQSMYLLGYLPATNRVYLGDKDVNVVTYLIPLPVLEYQTAVMRGDFEAANQILPNIPQDQRTRVARFLEKRNFKEQALIVSTDADHRFELALSLDKLDIARDIAREAESELKWKQLSEKAMRACHFALAEECLEQAKDYSGLLLLSTSTGGADKMDLLATKTMEQGKNNLAFIALLLQGKVQECIALLCTTNRLAEAALFARSYCPSEVPRILALWKEELAKTNPKAAQALADPKDYPNLFPEIASGIQIEQYLRGRQGNLPANEYVSISEERTVPLEERLRSMDLQAGEARPPGSAVKPTAAASTAEADELDLDNGQDDDFDPDAIADEELDLDS